jgi:hypothetical protein
VGDAFTKGRGSSFDRLGMSVEIEGKITLNLPLRKGEVVGDAFTKGRGSSFDRLGMSVEIEGKITLNLPLEKGEASFPLRKRGIKGFFTINLSYPSPRIPMGVNPHWMPAHPSTRRKRVSFLFKRGGYAL